MDLYTFIEQLEKIKHLGLPKSFIIRPLTMFMQITQYVVESRDVEMIMRLGEITNCKYFDHCSPKLKDIFFKQAVLALNTKCKNSIGKILVFTAGVNLFIMTDGIHICKNCEEIPNYICKYSVKYELQTHLSQKHYKLEPTTKEEVFKIVENIGSKQD